ncbi:MAG: DUF421 domain-containing protein [Shimia sp.]
METSFLYPGLTTLLKVALSTPLAYAGLVILLRVGGKRTLADFNAFDFVVTVAIGSLLAATAVNPQISVLQGLTVMGLFVVLQGAVAWAVARSERVRRVVQARPTLLVHRGEVLPDALRAMRLSMADLQTALRASGYAQLDAIETVVMEADGRLSILTQGDLSVMQPKIERQLGGSRRGQS